jgi:hypothetical protein
MVCLHTEEGQMIDEKDDDEYIEGDYDQAEIDDEGNEDT